MAKQDDYVRYTIRVPQDVYAALERAAVETNRSVDAEIVDRLKFSVGNPPSAVEALKWELLELERDLHFMEIDLKEMADTIQSTQQINDSLRTMVESHIGFTSRLMYHVLSYIDEIPEELSLWAFDIAEISQRRMPDVPIGTGPRSFGAEERKAIIEKRTKFRANEIRKIKARLSDDTQGGESVRDEDN